MLTLSLLRHAKSSWGGPSQTDYTRPLNKRGEKAIPVMAAYIVEQRIFPDLILCSPATRTVQTLDRLLKAFASKPEVRYEDALYNAWHGAILNLLKGLGKTYSHVMVIGHNPGLQAFAMQILDEGEPDEVAALASKFPTAALAVFEFDVPSWRKIGARKGKLCQFVFPKALEAA